MARNRPRLTAKSPRNTGFKKMSPEDRVNMAVEMSSVVSTITMESILDQNPRISKAKLIQEGRKRFRPGRRVTRILVHLPDPDWLNTGPEHYSSGSR